MERGGQVAGGANMLDEKARVAYFPIFLRSAASLAVPQVNATGGIAAGNR
jgi:hypothetical protein